ncbi:hypothetical protein ACLOJK_035629 [Asimina triloba]
MIRSLNEKDFPAKKEEDTNDSKHPKVPSSSRPWSGLKDPRIVRVSRTFGGKDRHSKVCTIRGLRDRRVRLSVQTAIQLYDLQDRLGLNQPSKVVDWLLTVAQEDIDKLPPLQMLPEHFVQYPQPVMVSHEATPSQVPSVSFLGAKSDYEKSNGAHLLPSKENAKASNDAFGDDDQNMYTKSTAYWNSDASSRAKSKEVHSEANLARSYWMKRDEHHDASQVRGAAQMLPPHNPFPRPNLASLPSFLNNTTPNPSHYHLELPSNSSVAHFLGHGYSSQTEEINNCDSMSVPSSLAPPSGSQLLLYPSVSTPSIFPQFVSTSGECDPKQISHFQMLSSTPQNLLGNPLGTSLYSVNPTMRPFHVNITPIYHQSQNSHEIQSNALHKPSIGAASSAVTTNSFQSASKATSALGSTRSSFM